MKLYAAYDCSIVCPWCGEVMLRHQLPQGWRYVCGNNACDLHRRLFKMPTVEIEEDD